MCLMTILVKNLLVLKILRTVIHEEIWDIDSDSTSSDESEVHSSQPGLKNEEDTLYAF